MTTLASVAELGDFLHQEIDLESASAVQALEMATAEIQSETNRHLFFVEDDEVILLGNHSRQLLLPQYPVIDVAEVVVDGDVQVLDEDYIWDSAGRLTRLLSDWQGYWWQDSIVEVTYSHGYEEIPADLKRWCLSKASRLFGSSGGQVFQSESTGTYSYDRGTGAAAEVSFNEEERIRAKYLSVVIA